jgi:hypothetical protein
LIKSKNITIEDNNLLGAMGGMTIDVNTLTMSDGSIIDGIVGI